MSIENTAKSFGSAFVFTGVAWLSEVISGALGSLQSSSAAFLLDGGITVGVLAVTAGIVDFFLGTDIIATAAGIIAVFFGIQAFVSLLTLCVFYTIVRISPKGTYTLLDCIIAAGVCLLEAAPFISSFVFWGMFAAYLRQRQIRRQVIGAVKKVSSATGVSEDALEGFFGGFLGRVLGK